MQHEAEQLTIQCAIVRGGTSKGLFFHEADLPAPGPHRDRLLQRLMGSPDVLQIDGLGGSRPITSKVAIIKRSERPDADVDYTFAQVEIERAGVFHHGNCGNISAGVGPFAIDEGLVAAQDGVTAVRIYNTNTDKVIVAEVPVRNGRAQVEGDFAIPGVPGTGAEIVMNYARTAGARTGQILPTGRPTDRVALEDGRTIDVSLVDVANPCAWVRASDFGLGGSELSDAINGDAGLIAAVREVRGKAAVLCGLCRDWRHVDEESSALPMVGLVAPSADYVTLNGTQAAASEMDLRVRLLFMNRLHESIAGTGSMCLAAASRISGSVAAEIGRDRSDDMLRIGHPSGIMPVRVRTVPSAEPAGVSFEVLGFSRTARRLMDCNAYYPRSALTGMLQADRVRVPMDETMV